MKELRVEKVSKEFNGKKVVDTIDLSVFAGQFIAFLGPNGAGKSTTINMLTGTILPTEGTILMDNHAPQEKEYQREIGVVFQKSVLDEQLTVWQNLKSRSQMYTGIHLEKESQLIQEFGLKELLNQRYGALSGGQRRRVDIARALIHSPSLLFLDEPSTGLDIQTRQTIWNILEKRRKVMGLTIILTTHYLEEADTADFVYIIDHGQIIARDTVHNLKKQYASILVTVQSDNLEEITCRANPAWSIIKQDKIAIFSIEKERDAIQFLYEIRLKVSYSELRHGTMDDIFVALTGKGIR
ncbi:MAG: ABC transporter ATP-binding protein [Enterococcus sp.]